MRRLMTFPKPAVQNPSSHPVPGHHKRVSKAQNRNPCRNVFPSHNFKTVPGKCWTTPQAQPSRPTACHSGDHPRSNQRQRRPLLQISVLSSTSWRILPDWWLHPASLPGEAWFSLGHARGY